jgi:hypothetical protein
MLLTENFVEILAKTNQLSPKIAGHLFVYDKERKMFHVRKKGAKTGFKLRSYFLILNAAALILRTMMMAFQPGKETDNGTSQIYMNMCMMMICSCTVAAGRYHVRGESADVYVLFFNTVIQVEQIHIRG